LHQSGCFILPSPWDVGSARMLDSLGFEALASTSAGYAWSTGRPYYAVTRDDVLEQLTTLANSVNPPLNAYFEAGFAPDLEGVTENVYRAIAVGVAGLSIEDRIVGQSGLYDIATSVERLKAARAAIDQSGEDVILVARTEGLLLDATALKPAIEKLVAFGDAGADCLYAPGARNRHDIAELVKAVAPKPINIVMNAAWPELCRARRSGRPADQHRARPGSRDVGFGNLRSARTQRGTFRCAGVRHSWCQSGRDVPFPLPTHKCTGRTTGDSVMSLVNL
jgi:2-methylisocitrate lyase-like PEP mutase family enzyme